MGVLDGAARDCDFGNRATGGVDHDVSRGRAFLVMVSLDVTGSDVQVTDFAADSDDASSQVIADMAADNVGLVQVDAIEE